VLCAACEGSGSLVTFVETVIRWEPSEEVTRVRADPLGRRTRKYWQSYGPFPGKEPPDGLPSDVREQMLVSMKRVGPGEIKRELLVRVLPLAVIESQWRGSRRTTYLLGGDRRVIANWVYLASRRLWGLVVGTLMLAAAAALILARL